MYLLDVCFYLIENVVSKNYYLTKENLKETQVWETAGQLVSIVSANQKLSHLRWEMGIKGQSTLCKSFSYLLLL